MKTLWIRVVLLSAGAIASPAFASGSKAPSEIDPANEPSEASLELHNDEYTVSVSPDFGAACGWGAESTAKKTFNARITREAPLECAPDQFVKILPYDVQCKTLSAARSAEQAVSGCAGQQITACGIATDNEALAICRQNPARSRREPL